MMMGHDYVDFCNLAARLREQVERHLEQLSDNTLQELAGFVRFEHAATNGVPPPDHAFLAAMMNEEIAFRRRKTPCRSTMPTNDNGREPVPAPDWSERPF